MTQTSKRPSLSIFSCEPLLSCGGAQLLSRIVGACSALGATHTYRRRTVAAGFAGRVRRPHIDRYQSGINPLRIPAKPTLLSGAFACTADIEAGLAAITWRGIPFRQEGDKLTGLYGFRDSFGYQDSVMFSGSSSEEAPASG